MPGLNLIVNEREDVTIADLQRLFPKKSKTITQLSVDVINDSIRDPLFNGYSLVDTLIDYEQVMYEKKGSMMDYIYAVKFCAHMEDDGTAAINAYKKTFKFREFVKSRWDDEVDSPGYNALQAAATRYRKSPMVQAIMTRAKIAVGMLFQSHLYSGIQTLYEESKNAPFSKDRINAADKMIGHLLASMPVEQQISLNVGPDEDSKKVQSGILDQLVEIGKQQRDAAKRGEDFSKVQKMNFSVNNDDALDAEIEDRKDG